MSHKISEKGQALVFIVVTIVGLIAMTGLTVDVGRTYVDRQSAQTSADDAALAAALAKAKNSSITLTALTNTAKSIAANNGYIDGSTSTITVTNPPGISCNGTDSVFAGNSEYINVRINTNVNTYFAPFVGISQTHNCVEATSRAVTGTSGSSGMYGGAAIVATKLTGSQAMLLNGNAAVHTTGTGAGVFINSSDSQALFLNGGASLTMTAPARVVGGYFINGGGTITPSVSTGQIQLTMPDPAWASIPAIPATPTCSTNGTVASGSGYTLSGSPPSFTANGTVTATINPGNWGNIIVNGAGSTITLNPGTYCLGGLTLNGSGVISMPSGQVNLVISSNSITLNSGVTLNANNLEIYATTGNWLLNGGATMNATRLRFYSSGSSSFTVNGNATLTSSNAHIRLTSGAPVWNGNSTITLTAPPTGDPLAGLLFYMPWSNTSPVIINGGSNVTITGTMLMPHSAVTANGGASFNALHSQIIGYSFLFNGGGNFDVNYNPNENYGSSPSVSSTIELIK